MPFNPTTEQTAVLAHPPTRHARILAGPGTGKSATVVAWLEQLLNSDRPPRIRLLTFTRAATGELAKKVSDHPHASTLRPGTVHSFAIATLLSNEGAADFPSPLRIADDWETDVVVYPRIARRTGATKKQVERLFKELAAGWEALDDTHRDQRIDDALRRRFRATLARASPSLWIHVARRAPIRPSAGSYRS